MEDGPEHPALGIRHRQHVREQQRAAVIETLLAAGTAAVRASRHARRSLALAATTAMPLVTPRQRSALGRPGAATAPAHDLDSLPGHLAHRQLARLHRRPQRQPGRQWQPGKGDEACGAVMQAVNSPKK